MKLNILNNECINRSPCLSCERKDKDKDDCINTCKILAAYRNNKQQEGENKKVKQIDKTDNNEIIKTKAETRKQKICVMCNNKTKEILNKKSQTCKACYQAWRKGKKEHPVLGKFKPLLSNFNIPDMSKYPKIMQYIVDIAQKSLLPAEHVFIQLLAEGITARQEKDGDKG